MNKIENIKIHTKTEEVNGFTFQKGFVSFELDGEKRATSGWRDEKNLYCYKLGEDNKWHQTWIMLDDPKETPEGVLELIEMFEDEVERKELEKALEFAKGKKLYESAEAITFIDVVAGRKSNNGGEYGFSTIYEPIPNYPGIYRKRTTTTCDFDNCSTGDEGIIALTKKEYKKLLEKESKVLEEGNKYN